MRERRYVKFKLDIYDDTKTKIIDQRPERDFIHYFFARSIILAGKSDCEGDLYMAKNIPYTIETLAIEFNREVALVKLALDLLIQLKMIEVTEDNIYRVKGFVKHQNIKAKENAEINDKEKTDAQTTINKEVKIKQDKRLEDSRRENIQEDCAYENNEIQEKNENKEITSDNIRNTEIAGVNMEEVKINTKQAVGVDSINITDEENIYINSESGNISNYLSNNDTQENIQPSSEQDNLVILKTKDNQRSKKKRKSESKLVTEIAADEIEDNQPILVFLDGDMPPLEEGERLVWGQTLG